MRTCFLHIGTHKTGTTSLQLAMSSRPSELRARGYLYPRTGRPLESAAGHHNIAWEISGDRRFRPNRGTIDDLIAEVSTVYRDVILSSEDFECSLHHPERFGEFIQRLRDCPFDVKTIIYFRHQVDYAVSLYFEMLKFGVHLTFEEFVETILREGRFTWREGIFNFSYHDLVERLQAIDGLEVIVRSFDRVKDKGLFDDFLSILGLSPTALAVDAHTRANQRIDLVAAGQRFYQNRSGGPVDEPSNRIIERLLAPLTKRAVGPSRSTAGMLESFRQPGKQLLSELEPVPLGRQAQFERDEDRVTLENVFSSDLVRQVDELTARKG